MAWQSAWLTTRQPWSTICFLVGLTFSLVLPFGGNLILAEVLLVVFAAAVAPVVRPAAASPRFLNVTIILFAVAALSVVVWDFASGNPLASSEKTWARHFALLALIISFSALARRRVYSQRAFIIGSALGAVVAVLTKQPYVSLVDPWKYNLAPWVCAAALALVQGRGRGITLAVLLALCAVNVAVNFRAMLLVVALVAFLVLTRRALERVELGNMAKRTLLVTTVTVGALIAGTLYDVAITSGMLGASAAGKHEFQASYRGGILAAARPELPFAWRAIGRSPILPQGSNPQDPELAEGFYQALRDINIVGPSLDAERLLIGSSIPIHSLLQLWWVESGLIGAIVWLACGFAGLVYVDRFTLGRTEPDVVLAFFTVLMLWNIVFSPMAPQYRMAAAETIGPMFIVLYAGNIGPKPGAVRPTPDNAKTRRIRWK